MEKKSETLENFKTAIGSTVKSLSNSENIEVFFGNENFKSEKKIIKLPEIEQRDNKINYDQIRAIADSESLKLRFSNPKIFKSYEPDGNISKKLYKIAEKIRYEKLGSEQFKGVKNNILKHYQSRINSLDLKSSEDKIVESFENYLRDKFFGSKSSKDLEKKLKVYKKDLDKKMRDKIGELNNLTLDQKKYNALISNLISEMSLDENTDEEDKKEEEKNDNRPKNSEKQDQSAEKQQQGNKGGRSPP